MHRPYKIQKIVVKTLFYRISADFRGYECILMQYNIISLLSICVKYNLENYFLILFMVLLLTIDSKGV